MYNPIFVKMSTFSSAKKQNSSVDGPRGFYVMLSEISQRKGNGVCYHQCVESKNINYW